jgi:hypothetical protein
MLCYNTSSPGLPDGLFLNQNSQFWFVLRAVGLEKF